MYRVTYKLLIGLLMVIININNYKNNTNSILIGNTKYTYG